MKLSFIWSTRPYFNPTPFFSPAHQHHIFQRSNSYYIRLIFPLYHILYSSFTFTTAICRLFHLCAQPSLRSYPQLALILISYTHHSQTSIESSIHAGCHMSTIMDICVHTIVHPSPHSLHHRRPDLTNCTHDLNYLNTRYGLLPSRWTFLW